MADTELTPVEIKVENQTPRVGLGPDGRPSEGIEVHFVTGMGNRSSVFVPKAEYSVDKVRELLRAHATELDAVKSITAV